MYEALKEVVGAARAHEIFAEAFAETRGLHLSDDKVEIFRETLKRQLTREGKRRGRGIIDPEDGVVLSPDTFEKKYKP